MLTKYNDIILQQLENGIIEVADKTKNKICHYNSHHLVVPANKSPSKCRVVYNASYKSNKDAKSLNDCLMKGPIPLNDLTGILIRMKIHQIIFSK